MNREQNLNIADTIIKISETITLFAFSFITGFGRIIILPAVMLAEFARVKQGVMLFEDHTYIANIVSFVLITMLFVVDVSIVGIEKRYNHDSRQYKKNNLRRIGKNILYRLGIPSSEDGFEEIDLSPAHDFRAFQNILVWSLVIASAFGSIADILYLQNSNLFIALLRTMQAKPEVMLPVVLAASVTWAIISGANLITKSIAYDAIRIEQDIKSEVLEGEFEDSSRGKVLPTKKIAMMVKKIEDESKTYYTNVEDLSYVSGKDEESFFIRVEDSEGNEIEVKRFSSALELEYFGMREFQNDLRKWKEAA